jgi:hypothetical protein
MVNFLSQFQDLLKSQPRYNLKGVNSENCDYADTAVNSKNCYYSFGTFHCEDLLYGRYSRNCTNCTDVTFSFDCEWCYECIGCSKSYALKYSKYSDNCSNSYFLENCIGCKDCFGCIGLNQKQYHFFNQPLSKEEYKKRINEFIQHTQSTNNLSPLSRVCPEQSAAGSNEGGDVDPISSPCKGETGLFALANDQRGLEVATEGSINKPTIDPLQPIKAKLEQLRQSLPTICTNQTMTENSTGDNIVQAQNAHMCFDAYDLEDCNYCIETNSLKDCTDMTVCFNTQESYQCVHCPNNYQLKFCIHCDNCSESEFCAYSMNLRNCFGCVYMKDKEYHILNKPYEPEEYKRTVKEIKAQLINEGQYNLLPYFTSGYEQERLRNESDPSIRS